MDEPAGGAAAAVADQALAVNPVAAAGAVFDAIIIAQPRRGRLAPPFGRDPLRPLGPRDVMHGAAPYEPPRHALGCRINDGDRFGPVEQALRATRRWQCNWFDLSESRNPPARVLGQMALVRLW